MRYPGRIIKAGEQDEAIVKGLKKQLNRVLGTAADPALRLDPSNGEFGPRMKQLVKLFQARHVDSEGQPLKQDGQVGAITWEVLFGGGSVPSAGTPRDQLLVRMLEIAASEEARGVREVPVNSNRGPRVEEYLSSTRTPPGNSWCCAFVYWCFDRAAAATGRANPMVRTAGCLDHWNRAPAKGAKRIPKRDAAANPGLVKPGMVFIVDHGAGKGHTGVVEQVCGGFITTVEGNTDASKTREGGGVYRLTRKILDINKGFIDYSGVGS